MGSGTHWPIGHMKGPATEGWSPSEKKKGMGPKKKKGKKESPTGQPSRNQHKQQNPQAQEEAKWGKPNKSIPFFKSDKYG